jgi:UDP-N-acetylenolpyruvoylglucosamine reductase
MKTDRIIITTVFKVTTGNTIEAGPLLKDVKRNKKAKKLTKPIKNPNKNDFFKYNFPFFPNLFFINNTKTHAIE